MSITAYFEAPKSQVRQLNDLQTAYIMRCRYPRWQGPLVDLHATRRLPLYAPAAVGEACLMHPDDLHLERVHFHNINAASPELAAMPFANDSWRGDEMPQPDPITGPKFTKRPPASATREQRDIVASYPQSPLWELVDRNAVDAAMDHLGELRPFELHQMLGTITALIWLDHDELPSR